MIEPKFSARDEQELIDRLVEIHAKTGGTSFRPSDVIRDFIKAERRRVLKILADPRNRGLTRRELAELVAKGR